MSNARAEDVLDILIVDDTEMNRKAINIVIQKTINSKKNVHFAANGQEAVYICEKKSFTMIFMDHHMPIMLGDEATKQIRLQNGGKWKEGELIIHPDDKCIIITCSATTTTEIGYEGKHPGANYCLNKPIKQAELWDLLTMIAEKHKKCITMTSPPNLTQRSSPPVIQRMGSEIKQRGSHVALQTVLVKENSDVAKPAGFIAQSKPANCNDSFFPCAPSPLEPPKSSALKKEKEEQNCCKKYCTIL